MIQFTVPAIPIAQPRPRVFNIGGRARAVSAPQKHPVTAFKATCRMAAQAAYSGAPLGGALCIGLVFVMPRPKGATKKRGDNPRFPHTKRPDFDNLAKSVLDALTGILWLDDAQIADVSICKWVAGADEVPRVEITLSDLT